MTNNKIQKKLSILLISIVFAMVFVVLFFPYKEGIFYAEAMVPTFANVTPISLAGKGTASNPYLIYNGNDLVEISQFVNSGGDTGGKYYKVATPNTSIAVSSSLSSIGTNTYPFKGTFDGNGVTITGSLPTNSNDNYCGLFGKTYGATIKNITIAFSAKTVSCSFSGGLIAYAQYGGINNCNNKTRIVNQNNFKKTIYVGGLVGRALNTIISQSSNSANISGATTGKTTRREGPFNCYVGGLLGYGSNVIISACKVMSLTSTNIQMNATSQGSTYCGGLVGYISNESTTKSFCTGAEVYGYGIASSYVGGVAGFANGHAISNCFNRSKVTAMAQKRSTNAVTSTPKEKFSFGNSQLNMTSSNQKYSTEYISAYAGGIVGFSTGNVSSCYNVGTVSGGYTKVFVETSASFYYGSSGSSGQGSGGNTYNSTIKANCTFISKLYFSDINGNVGKNSNSCYGKNTNITSNISLYSVEDWSKRNWLHTRYDDYDTTTTGSNQLENSSNNGYSYKSVNFTNLAYGGTTCTNSKVNYFLSKSSCRINISLTANYTTGAWWWEEDHSDPISFDLYKLDDLAVAQNYTIRNMKNSSLPSGFSTDIWAVSSYINDGYPHLKQFYWQDQAWLRQNLF